MPGRKEEDVYRACLIVSISNSAFSIFAGFATFSLVGHMAKVQGVEVEDIATRSGTGLAFITIAAAMEYFGPLANVFSILFFVMLFILGLNSVYAWLETVASYVHDHIHEKNSKK
jgi:SNF family Na+-dependent transporter